MEEILSSIRRIIADEEAGEARPDAPPARDLDAADETAADEAAAGQADRGTDPAAAAADDDVLELTRVVRESGEVVDLRARDDAAAPDEEPAAVVQAHSDRAEDHPALAAAPAEARPSPEDHRSADHRSKEDRIAVSNQAAREELLSDAVATAATGAFARLAHASQRTPAEESIADADGRTIEQFVEDLIRPMLKEWLDEKLPPIIERVVEKEVQKIARRAELT